jgi:predicted lipoprotein with Yx(FWY)xxD motif
LFCVPLKRLFIVGAAVAALAASTAAAAVIGGHKHAGSAGDWTVSLRKTAYGKILVDSKGDTLYLWAADRPDESECSSDCLAVWPFVLVSNTPTAGPGINPRLLGTIDVPQGDELTYNKHPLYTFISDSKPGEALGEGSPSYGAPWWVVSAAGKAITKQQS